MSTGAGDGAYFLIASDVDVVMVGAAVGQSVDQPRGGLEFGYHHFFIRANDADRNPAEPRMSR